ncbi:hypothetical protein ACFY97_04635 [Streptomyces klenkii]|uniref:hypothetical protein n=1 Tax=Streptomyces klenkii TaxID=1420899 RepID=UPI0036E3ABC1
MTVVDGAGIDQGLPDFDCGTPEMMLLRYPGVWEEPPQSPIGTHGGDPLVPVRLIRVSTYKDVRAAPVTDAERVIDQVKGTDLRTVYRAIKAEHHQPFGTLAAAVQRPKDRPLAACDENREHPRTQGLQHLPRSDGDPGDAGRGRLPAPSLATTATFGISPDRCAVADQNQLPAAFLVLDRPLQVS